MSIIWKYLDKRSSPACELCVRGIPSNCGLRTPHIVSRVSVISLLVLAMINSILL